MSWEQELLQEVYCVTVVSVNTMTYPDRTKLESQSAVKADAKLHDTIGIDWIHTQVTDLCRGFLQFLYVSVKHRARREAYRNDISKHILTMTFRQTEM